VIFLAVLFSTFLSFSITDSFGCDYSVLKNNFKKYKNKFTQDFEIYSRGEELIWSYNDKWYVNKLSLKNSYCPRGLVINNSDRIVLMSSTLLEVFVELNKSKNIVGVSEKRFIYQAKKKLPKALSLGAIPNIERVLSLNPSIFFGYKTPVLENFYRQLNGFKIPLVFIDDFSQKHPLGRAELRVLLGAFLGDFKTALLIFERVVSNYQISSMSVETKVNVLLGMEEASGSWKKLMPESDFSKVVADAGGVDILSDLNSQQINPEKVIERIKNVDFWLPQYGFSSTSEVASVSNLSRFFLKNRDLKITTYTKKIMPSGGVEYWDVAMMRPDILLEDLIKIFRTSKKSSGETRWYRILK